MDCRVGVYIRLSKEDEGKNKESESIINQRQYIKEYIERNRMTIYDYYIDDGYTGNNFDRPNFKRIIKDIKIGLINTVITKDFSRLGREYIETAYYITKFFPENNIRYIAINDNYDSQNTMYNDIIIGFKSIMNDKYIKDTSMKIREIKRMKTNQGHYMGFMAPYGYIKENKNNKITLRIDNLAAKVVERIFKEVASGVSTKEVANSLNKEKILPPMQYLKMTKSRNKNYYDEWSDKIIYRIIRNHTYTGDNVIRKSVKPNYKQLKRTWVAIKDREIKESTHPPIVTQELFEEANSNIKRLKRKENRIKNYKGMYNGMIFCGECGAQMSVTGRIRESGNIYYHFYCKNKGKKYNKCENNKKISDGVLQQIVYKTLKEIIDRFVNKKKVMEKVLEDFSKKEGLKQKIKNIETTIESHNNRIRNLYIQKTKDKISEEDFVKIKDIENIKKENLERELENLIKQKESVIKQEELEKKYSELITEGNIYKFAFKDLIKKVIFKKDRSIIIEFNFDIMPNRKVQK